MRRGASVSAAALLLAAFLLAGCSKPPKAIDAMDVPPEVVARLVVFYADTCEVCTAIQTDVLTPLQERCRDSLELKLIDIEQPDGYALFLETETALIGESGRWTIPAVVIDDKSFIGESAIRDDMLTHLACVFGSGGNDWPEVAGLSAMPTVQTSRSGAGLFGAAEGIQGCADDAAESEVCATPNPIFVLYLADSVCEEHCDRTLYDLRYLQGVYPQLSVDQRDIEANRDLAEQLGERFQVPQDLRGVAPAVVVGDDYLVGAGLNLAALRGALARYAETGALAVWYTLGVD